MWRPFRTIYAAARAQNTVWHARWIGSLCSVNARGLYCPGGIIFFLLFFNIDSPVCVYRRASHKCEALCQYHNICTVGKLLASIFLLSFNKRRPLKARTLSQHTCACILRLFAEQGIKKAKMFALFATSASAIAPRFRGKVVFTTFLNLIARCCIKTFC